MSNQNQSFGVGWIPENRSGYILTEHAVTVRGGYISERGLPEDKALSIALSLNEATLMDSGSYVPVFTYS